MPYLRRLVHSVCGILMLTSTLESLPPAFDIPLYQDQQQPCKRLPEHTLPPIDHSSYLHYMEEATRFFNQGLYVEASHAYAQAFIQVESEKKVVHGLSHTTFNKV